MTLSLVKTISPFIITVGSLILNHETGIQSSVCLACVAWRFLDKLSELRKRGNRNNKPQGREEPGRETTEKPLHSRSKNSLNRQATQATTCQTLNLNLKGHTKSLSLHALNLYCSFC